MPKDVKGLKVENFRLTRGQLDFQKKVKRVDQIRTALRMKFQLMKQEMDNLGLLANALEEGASKIQPPEEGVRDLPGMDFGVGENEETDQRMINQKSMLNY